MKQDKAVKLQQTAQGLQNKILGYSSQMYQASVNGMSFEKITENMLTTEAQLQILIQILKEDPVEAEMIKNSGSADKEGTNKKK